MFRASSFAICDIGFRRQVPKRAFRIGFVSTTKKSSQYQRERAIAENQYTTLSVGLNLKNRQPVLIRDFKPGILSSEAQWTGFRALLEERRQTHVAGMLRVAGISGSLTQPYLVITGTTGQSLRNALSKLETPDLSDLLRALQTAATGLDSLHELGHVHGDVRPETLFFDNEGQLLVNEITTHYALCGWGHQSQEMQPGFFGAVFPTTNLAPEVRQGGRLTPQTDQYALGLVLFELCTGLPRRETTNIQETLSGANVNPSLQAPLRKLRPVLERALALDPLSRYPNCKAMLADAEARLEESPARQWLALGLGTAAAFAGVGLLLSWLFQKDRPEGDDAWKAAAVHAIEKKYQAEIRLVPSVTPRAQAPPTETTAAGPILEEIRTKLADQQLGALKSQLKSVALEALAQPNSPSFQFLHSPNPMEILYLDAQHAAAWKAVLAFEGELPDQDLDVRVELYDVDQDTVLAKVPIRLEGKQLKAPLEKVTWNAEQKSLMVDLGNVAVPDTMQNPSAKWALGTNLGVRVSIDFANRQIWWNKSPTYQVGELVRINQPIAMSLSEVRKQGFQIDTGMALKAGQQFRLKAKGQIQPGTAGSYQVMTGKQDRVPIGPFGLTISSTGNTKHYSVSTDNQEPIKSPRWGALLMKIGARSDWEWPLETPGTGDLDAVRTAETAGNLMLSIDSVKYIDNRPLNRPQVLVSDDRFWQSPDDGGGQFDVTIETIQLLPGDLPAEISQILMEQHGQLAIP